jgi:hypothetical protein
MRIEDALRDVQTIQSQLARTERFCCYRWATVAASGLFALIAAAVQSLYLPSPLLDLHKYLGWWIGVAGLSVTVIGAQMLLQWRQSPSPFFGRQTLAALRQFAPCVLAGALVTWAIATESPEHAALFPGLWAIIFSLGVFASAAHLPPGGTAVAIYYLITGLVCIVWGQGQQALQPWTMFVTFGIGQWMAAAVLYGGDATDEEIDD